MAKKKILFLGQLPPPIHGVSIINSWILESAAIAKQYQITPLNLATARSIADIGKQSPAKYAKFLKLLGATLLKLITTKFTFVYITLSPTGSAFLKDSILVLLAKLFGVPVLIHLHGKGIAKKLAISSKLLRRYYNHVFNNTNVIILAETLRRDLEPITSFKQLFILPNGVTAHSFTPKTPSPNVQILHLSNMIESKGSFDLLTAINVLEARGITNFRVNFVGNWDNDKFKEKFLNYLSENKLEDVAYYLGPLYGDDKHAILQQSHIFVLPTYYANECFPLTILEAMNAGLAIIATREGAIPEIIEEKKDGYLVVSQNPEALADALEGLIHNQTALAAINRHVTEKFMKQFTFSHFEHNLLAIFNEISS